MEKLRTVAVAAVALALALTSSGNALARDYLEEVKSPVFEATGDHGALTRRAAACFAKLGGVASQNLLTDPDGGTVVGSTLFPITEMGVPWSAKGTLTIEAKDGRFRMGFTDLLHKQGGPATQPKFSLFSGSVDQSADGGWMRVAKQRFGGADKVEAGAQALAVKIADCVKKPADDW